MKLVGGQAVMLFAGSECGIAQSNAAWRAQRKMLHCGGA